MRNSERTFPAVLRRQLRHAARQTFSDEPAAELIGSAYYLLARRGAAGGARPPADLRKACRSPIRLRSPGGYRMAVPACAAANTHPDQAGGQEPPTPRRPLRAVQAPCQAGGLITKFQGVRTGWNDNAAEGVIGPQDGRRRVVHIGIQPLSQRSAKTTRPGVSIFTASLDLKRVFGRDRDLAAAL